MNREVHVRNESRGSRTDLGAPGGETPPGDSTFSPIRHVVSHRLQSADSSRSLELVVAERARPARLVEMLSPTVRYSYAVMQASAPMAKRRSLAASPVKWCRKAPTPEATPATAASERVSAPGSE